MNRPRKLLLLVLTLSFFTGTLEAIEPPKDMFSGSLVGKKYKTLSKGDVLDVYFIRDNTGTWFGRFMFKNRRKLFSGVSIKPKYAWTAICEYEFDYYPEENVSGLFEKGHFKSKNAEVETSFIFTRVWDGGWDAMGHIYGTPKVAGDDKPASVMCNFTTNFNYDMTYGTEIQTKGVRELVEFVAKRNGFRKLHANKDESVK